MLQKLQKNRLNTKTVRRILEALDSIRVEERKSKKFQQRLYHSNLPNHI